MPQISRVVHVMRRFVPDAWGGTEEVVYRLSRELIGRGIDSPVHCTCMLSAPGHCSIDSVPVHRHGYVFPWVGLSSEDKRALALKGGSPLSLSLFIGLLRERNPSIIHAHVQHRLGGMARTAACLKRIPYIVSLHGGYFTLPQDQISRMKAPFAGKLEWGRIFGALFGARRVLDDADGIICVGLEEYSEARKRYPAKRVYHVPNGVDVQRFAKANGHAFRQAHGINPTERIILCVSRIDFQKNQLGLVRAFGRFAERNPDYRLVLLGPVAVESYRIEIMNEIKRLSLTDKVRMIEGLRPDDPLLPSAYKAAEMCVLPSIYEPFGMVVLEAWAAGAPVLASRVGGIPGYAKDRQTALLVEPGNEEELFDGLEELAGNGVLRIDLADEAFKTVSAGFDWSVIADRVLEIYRELVEEHSWRRTQKNGIKTGENKRG